MSALARGNDASLVELPREVWSRGARPLQGRLLRWGIATSIVLLGLAFPMMAVRIGAVAVAALVFFGVFPLVDSRLQALGETLGAASRSEASKLMSGLDERWVVSRFAPHVWVSAQKGRLNMIKGDPRAAAAAFAEAARQSGNAQQRDLLGSQAHALVLSGDPKGARQLLLGMEEREELRSLDAFNLGVAYVEEPGKTSRAVELLELARKDLGAAPRTDAALALAYARDGSVDDAAALLEAMDESDFEDDDTAKDLHKRARRSLRQATESKGPKGKKRSGSARTGGADNPKPAKTKKDRRKERREKRKARGGKKSRKGNRSGEEELNKGGAAADSSAPLEASDSEKNAASEKAAADKAAAEKAASEKAASEKAASEKAAADKAAAKAASEKAAADKAAAKAASEKAASEKAAAAETAAKAAADKAAAAKAAADREAAQRVAARKAVEKAAADKAAEARDARAQAVADALARSAEEDDPASEEKAKAAAETAARAAAERARDRAKAKANVSAAPEKPLFGSGSQPLFIPPPVPAFGSETGPRNGAKPVAPKLPAPPKVGPPKVAAPPVAGSVAKKPAIDTDGWDDLFGDD